MKIVRVMRSARLFRKLNGLGGVVVGLCVLLLGCQNSDVTTFEHDGLSRTYRLHISKKYDGTVPLPLLVALHGKDQTGDDMKPLTGFDKMADTEGFHVVFPDAYQQEWNDGRAVSGTAVFDVDDVGFINALVDQIAATVQVDTHRVYAAGMSNGAMMAYRLACEIPDRFAAIAPVCGAMVENMVPLCTSTTPVPLIIFSGDADPIVPWEGGMIILDNQPVGSVLSVENSVAFWVDRNHCVTPPQETIAPDLDSADGARAYLKDYPAAENGADVLFYRIDGGGHTWPGGPSYQRSLGAVCMDINASSLIWDFCVNHRRE